MKTSNLLLLLAAGAGVAFVMSGSGQSGPTLTRLKPNRLSFVDVGETYFLEIEDVPDAILAMADSNGELPLDSVAVNTVHDMRTEREAFIEDGKLILPVTFLSPSEKAEDVQLLWTVGTPFPIAAFNINARAEAASMGRRRLTGRRVGHYHESVRVPGVV